MLQRGSISPRVAAALHRQNGWLRKNIELEGQSIAALPAASAVRRRMAEYNSSLLTAVRSNDEALATLFGAAPAWEWPWASWDWPWADQNLEIYNGLGSAWRHLVKDWSVDGAAGFQELHKQIRAMVDAELATAGAGEKRVLLPGCGTARLAWELARALPDAHIVGTDTSEAQLAVARHMLSCEQPGSLIVYPYLDESRNNGADDSRRAAVSVPDVAPARDGAPNLRLVLMPPGSASLVPAGEPRYDVVCTCFFLDCLPDTLAGVRAVRDALRPGGLFIFAGPLEWHSWPGLCPTLSQLMELARETGLEPLEAEPRLIAAPYVGKPHSLLHKQQWRAALFACRRTTADSGATDSDVSVTTSTRSLA